MPSYLYSFALPIMSGHCAILVDSFLSPCCHAIVVDIDCVSSLHLVSQYEIAGASS